MTKCISCGSEVSDNWIVKDGSYYNGQCTDCANSNCNDDKRQLEEDGK